MIPLYWFRPSAWLPNLIAGMVGILVLFVGTVAYDTLVDNTNITMEVGVARGWNNNIGLVVEYERAFTVHSTADGEVQRIIRCPPDGTEQWYFDGDIIKRTFQEGYYPPIKRPMQFPAQVPAGTKCDLEVWGSWRPRFAISSKRFLLDKMEFIVEETRPR